MLQTEQINNIFSILNNAQRLAENQKEKEPKEKKKRSPILDFWQKMITPFACVQCGEI